MVTLCVTWCYPPKRPTGATRKAVDREPRHHRLRFDPALCTSGKAANCAAWPVACPPPRVTASSSTTATSAPVPVTPGRKRRSFDRLSVSRSPPDVRYRVLRNEYSYEGTVVLAGRRHSHPGTELVCSSRSGRWRSLPRHGAALASYILCNEVLPELDRPPPSPAASSMNWLDVVRSQPVRWRKDHGKRRQKTSVPPPHGHAGALRPDHL
jgi:hypothetical protein